MMIEIKLYKDDECHWEVHWIWRLVEGREIHGVEAVSKPTPAYDKNPKAEKLLKVIRQCAKDSRHSGGTLTMASRVDHDQATFSDGRAKANPSDNQEDESIKSD
uniref:DUF2188 domain-containing protein n=1 Tax=Panagrellus redivivus TaxID=6233 RepID=A0A7E4W455_PANRE